MRKLPVVFSISMILATPLCFANLPVIGPPPIPTAKQFSDFQIQLATETAQLEIAKKQLAKLQTEKQIQALGGNGQTLNQKRLSLALVQVMGVDNNIIAMIKVQGNIAEYRKGDAINKDLAVTDINANSVTIFNAKSKTSNTYLLSSKAVQKND